MNSMNRRDRDPRPGPINDAERALLLALAMGLVTWWPNTRVFMRVGNTGVVDAWLELWSRHLEEYAAAGSPQQHPILTREGRQELGRE